MYGSDRNQLRRMYCRAWARLLQGLPLEPLEAAIAEVVREHPEYQRLLEDEERALAGEYAPEGGESNPFLHMGMHLGLREQLAVGRPQGITEVHRALLTRHGSAHEAEHRMMECLGAALWEAQRRGSAPDEAAYLTCLRGLLKG